MTDTRHVGVAEEVSDISLACRQIAPIRIKAKFEQGEDVFRKRRSVFFKKMHLRDQNIDLPQVRNDLFRLVSLPCHYSPP